MTTPLVPRNVLFGEPVFVNPRIAPDGRRLAYLEPVAGTLNLVTRPLGSGAKGTVLTDENPPGPRWFRWALDGQHLLWQRDGGGDENWRLWCVDIGQRRIRELTPATGARARLVGLDVTDPARLLVAINDRDAALHDLYEVDLATGARRLRCRNNRDYADWVVDSRGVPRAALRMTDDGGMQLCTLDNGGTSRIAFACGPVDASTTSVVGAQASGTGIYLVSSVDHETARLLHLDLTTGALTPLFADPANDVDQVVCHPLTGRPQLAAVCADRMVWHALEPGCRPALPLLNRPEADVRVVGGDQADGRWVLNVAPADGSLWYELYDRTSGDTQPLGRYQPALDEHVLSPTTPFRYLARDGLHVSGYLTFPVDRPRRQLPAVVLVHGGPWGRDTWGFEPVAQWLANRGYLVVQVNFRGSTGFGRTFAAAGDRECGAAMQTDLFDAVEWLVTQGTVDPCRVAMMGSSYGGYAALMAAALAPAAIRCVVALAPPVNLVTLLESVPAYWGPVAAMLRRRVGDPVVDRALLWSRSPLACADRVRAPVLLATGDNDVRVPSHEVGAFVARLRAGGVAVRHLPFADEGHTITIGRNRLVLAAAIERFLGEHLGGRVE